MKSVLGSVSEVVTAVCAATYIMASMSLQTSLRCSKSVVSPLMSFMLFVSFQIDHYMLHFCVLCIGVVFTTSDRRPSHSSFF
jgi:hypothetical protein